MYKVKLENGYVANFDEEPTMEAVEELASLTKDYKAPVEKEDIMRKGPVGKVLGFGSDLLYDTVRAPVRAVMSAGLDAAAGVTGLATGKNVRAEFQPKGALQEALLGKESIKGMGLNMQERVAKYTAGSKDPVKALGAINKGIALGALDTVPALLPLAGGPAKKGVELVEKKIAQEVAKNVAKKSTKRTSVIENIIAPNLESKKVRTELLSRGGELSKKDLAKMTPEELAAYNNTSNIGISKSDSIFDKFKPEFDKDVVENAKRIRDYEKSSSLYLKPGDKNVPSNIMKLRVAENKSFDEVTNTVDNYVNGKGSEYKPLDSDKIVEELTSSFDKIKNQDSRKIITSGSEEAKKYNETIEIAKEMLKKGLDESGGITQRGLLNTLRDWNKASGGAFEGVDNIKKVAIKDVRGALREALVNSLPKNIGKKIDELMKNNHAFIEARQNIAEVNNKLLNEKTLLGKGVKFLKNKAGAALGGAAVTGIGLGLLNK